jgi:hypothetical protein
MELCPVIVPVIDKNGYYLSHRYHPEGTTLANFLRTWVPANLIYNYRTHKFITREKFQGVVATLRECKKGSCMTRVSYDYEGLRRKDWADMTRRYMEEADKLWEWDILVSIDDVVPTENQRRRQSAWMERGRRRKERKLLREEGVTTCIVL